MRKPQKHKKVYFCNNTTWLSQYQVRHEFERYGAAAYFDDKYNVTEIFLSNTGISYFPLNKRDGNAIQQWKHAKWTWKVSLSVVIFLADMICHSRFREGASITKAILENLNVNHPIRS
eukprot:201265_1